MVLERAFSAMLVPPHQDPNQVLLGFRVPLECGVGHWAHPPHKAKLAKALETLPFNIVPLVCKAMVMRASGASIEHARREQNKDMHIDGNTPCDAHGETHVDIKILTRTRAYRSTRHLTESVICNAVSEIMRDQSRLKRGGIAQRDL